MMGGGMAAGQMFGQFGGALMDMAGTLYSNAKSEEAQKRAINFAREMARFRYQYTMKDMAKAGLNPILAYQQGAPPGGGAPGASFENPMEGMAASAQDAATIPARMKILANEVEQSRAAVHKTWAEEDEITERRNMNRAMTEKAKVDAETSKATAKNLEAQTVNTSINSALGATALPGAKSQERFDETQMGEFLRWVNRASRAVLGRDSTGAR